MLLLSDYFHDSLFPYYKKIFLMVFLKIGNLILIPNYTDLSMGVSFIPISFFKSQFVPTVSAILAFHIHFWLLFFSLPLLFIPLFIGIYFAWLNCIWFQSTKVKKGHFNNNQRLKILFSYLAAGSWSSGKFPIAYFPNILFICF